MKNLSHQVLISTVLLSILELWNESSQIILRNMERASELIQSFKKVAIDQEKMTMEAMDLKTVVEATVMSYSVELKNHGVQSELKFEGDLKGYSYPGAISQVLANLIQNSLMHAFQDENNNIEGQLLVLSVLQALYPSIMKFVTGTMVGG